MFSVPEDNLKYLNLAEGMTAADFGTGSGAYALALSRRIGPRGTIYAIDVQKDLLLHVQDAAKRAGLGNVQTLWGTIDEVGGTKLHDRVCDVVVISNVLFQSEDRQATIKEATRILKPQGEVLLIDWSGSAALGPRPEAVIKKDVAEKLFVDNGFALKQSFDAGGHHYGLVFKKTG